MSILTIAFAIAMAFFLVIGMVAIGVTELIGRNNDAQQTSPQDFNQAIDDEADSEERDLRQRVEDDPDDRQAHAQLAVLLANTGRVDEAIRHYERALQLDPDDTALRLSFARALEQRGFNLDLEIQLERVLEAESDNVEALFMLAELKERENPPLIEEADALYERVIETDPESFYAQMASERLAERSPDPDADDQSDVD